MINRQFTQFVARAGVAALMMGMLTSGALADQPKQASPKSLAPNQPWGNPNPAWMREKATLRKLGESHATAWDLYQSFKKQAHDIHKLAWDALPDWSGAYSRLESTLRFDLDDGPTLELLPPEQQAKFQLPSANLTPEYKAKYVERIRKSEAGVEFDPLSSCLPAGMPRWFTEPYLREFIVTPDQTWMINELGNEIRRIYTDGRKHPDEADRYPTFEGDSIGFWDGNRLIVHTNMLTEGRYQRFEPSHSDKAEVVEIWRKSGPNKLIADVWVYDPPGLSTPWFTRQIYTKEPNDDKSLRIRYYDCVGTPETRVKKTAEGSTTFEDLNFDKDKTPPSDKTPPARGDTSK